jgi:hypothetical protein
MKRGRRKLRNSEVEPRLMLAADEAPYFWVTKAALNRIKDAGGDSQTFAVYQAVAWLQNNHATQEFPASFGEIGVHAGCSPRTAERKIQLLFEAGLIGVKTGVRSDLKHERNRYTLATTRYVPVTQPLRQADATVTSGSPDSLAISKELLTGSSTPAPLATASPAATAGLVGPACGGDEAKGDNEW